MTVVAGGHVSTPNGLVFAAGLLVVPGFIDLQINVGFGHGFTSELATIRGVGAHLPGSGVT